MLERMARLLHKDETAEPAQVAAAPSPQASQGAVTDEQLITAIRTVYDPEIPVNIYDLGLIYGMRIGDDGGVEIDMTLTAPACPVAGTLPRTVEDAVRQVPGVSSAKVELVWDPPWTPDRLSDEARLELGMM
ncbi:MAG: SUF system Fe-S cluster assembly protein [Thiohalobacteraceae bacterium]